MNDIEFLLQQSDEAPIEPPPSLISEYIQGRRILPPGSPKPGPIDIYYAPYMLEPMDCMGPYSGINRITGMKSVQITFTTACGENVIAYYMDINPAEIMYCSGTTELLERWTKRLEPLIDSCGYRHKISAQVENTKSRKTGDKMYSKEYPGGSLSMVSLQSPAAQRSESKKILIVDEADSAPAVHTTGEGSFLGTLEGRTAAYGSNYKIMEFSTPALHDTSVIYKQFKAGDMRYYNMPCPRCGVFIIFKFEQLKPEYNDKGQLYSATYECQECHDLIIEHEKTWMMNVDRAEWIPTKEANDPTHRSYHINSLYSPVGMLSWKRIYQFYLDSEENIDLKPSFTNLYLGLPYREEGHRPDLDKVIKHRGDYKNGSVPEGVLYLVCASDVQRGAEKYQKMSPEELQAEIERIRTTKGEVVLWKSKIPRIETEVLGVGKNVKTWSVDYKVFYGHTTLGSFAGAFNAIDVWSQDGGMDYKRDDGRVFTVQQAMMDATDPETQNAVFDLCSRWRNTYPNINADDLKKGKDPGVDEVNRMNWDRYRINKRGNRVMEYVTLSKNHYMARLYSNLNTQRNYNQELQAPGFCDFPADRHSHYFKMLTAAEHLSDGSFSKGQRPAEALDCRAYALCAADIYLEGEVRKIREWYIKNHKLSEEQAKVYDKKYCLEWIERDNEQWVANNVKT